MTAPKPDAKGLILNAIPITIPDANVKVGYQPYKDEEHLREIRSSHRTTHVIKRRGESILDVPFVTGHDILGEVEEISLNEDRGLCQSLLLRAIRDYILDLGRPVLKDYPVDFFADDDLLKKSIPKGANCPDWLGVRVRYILDVRPHFPTGNDSFLALTIGVRTAILIDAPCSELIAMGINLSGLYVQQSILNENPRLRPRRVLMGRVANVQGGHLLLEDGREGIESIDADEAFLEPRNENLKLSIQAIFSNSFNQIIRNLDARRVKVVDGNGRLERIQNVASHFGAKEFDILPGINVSFAAPLRQGVSPLFPRVRNEDKPTYVFGPSPKSATWHDKGLNDFGPFDQATFTPTTPNIAVICQSKFRGIVEQFLRKLLDGIPEVKDRGGREIFGQGFIRKYCLDKCKLEFFETDTNSSDGYRKAIGKAIEAGTDANKDWNLAIVQSEDYFHQFSGDDNPYLVSKAALLQRGIPSQEIEVETMQSPDRQLVYILNNIALASYAKLGGIPWLLQANRVIAHELVFGLGSASIGEGRLEKRERIVGITTVFTGDGNYRLENRSKISTFEEYPQALLESLRSTISHVEKMLNWQPKDSVRLVFHGFNPFGKEQIEAVQKLVEDLTQYEVQYAFVHIVDQHPYLLFDESNVEGVWDSQAREKKGRLSPQRGTSLDIGDRECLLVLTGAREVKKPEDGLPSPILLRLDRSSTFKDMRYLTKQVYHFSSHSWRSFFPSPLPITVLYSELIANLLGRMSRLSNWDGQAMLGRIGRTRWFL